MIHWARAVLIGMIISGASAGCGDRGYTFKSAATYDVPRLGFRMTVEATGTVPSGADLSEDGTFTAVLSRLPEAGRPFAFLSGSQTNLTCRFEKGPTSGSAAASGQAFPWSSMDAAGSLASILRAAGFTNSVSEPDALEEAATTLFGPALGPKSTIIAGTSNIIVIKVSRQTDR